MVDNNIVIKITSEAKLDDAQKQLEDLTEQSNRLTKQMDNLKQKEKDDAAAIKALGLERDKESKRLRENANYYKQEREYLKSDIAERKKSIKELENQVKAYKTLNGMSGKAVQQLRAMREALMKMEDAGEFGTEAFMNLSIAAGKLEDQIGDTQQRIRVLASDTKEIDAVMGLGDGLAGSFYVATSAAELLGGDMEGLQQAFYKVQAAMSVVSGVQQVWNALNKDSAAMVVLNTALNKLFAKSKQKTAVATGVDAAASAADTAAKGAQATATGVATKAQWKLNAAMAANPLGVIIALVLAAVAAFAALGIGIYKLVHYFSDAGQAERDYDKSAKELEKIQAANAVGAAKRAYERQKQTKATDEAEEKALTDAKNRHASEIEMAQIKSTYAKRRAKEAQKYTDDEIRRNNREAQKLQEMVHDKKREVNAYKDGSNKKKKAQEELNEVEQQYYDVLQKTRDLENENKDAKKAAAAAAEEEAEARRQTLLQAQQANIDLMRDGAAKEIAQIKFNYKEQLKTLTDGSAETLKLRKALEAKQAKEILEVRRKYNIQAQQVAIQEQKNLLKAVSQSRGTETDYAQEITLTKAVAEQEAQARIYALEKEKMAEDDYKAQVDAIRLELASTLKQIDDEELNRKAEYARRLTDIELKEAEARKNALTGAEGVDEQKAILEDYYATRQKQLEENARLEREAVQRSTKTKEEKDAEIRDIETKLNADIVSLKKESAQAMIDVDAQYLSDLELAVSQAEDRLSRAQGLDRLDALKEQHDAQMALYDEQQAQLNAQWEAGLITFRDYKQQEWEITKATADAETEYMQEKLQTITEGFQTALGYMQQVSDMAFEALGSQVQAEIDALDEEYTTDAEEAKKNADKKYITEKELEKKKAALQMKQAKYAKTQAIINAAINTAMAITSTLAQMGATPWGIAMSVVAAAMGAAQMAIIAAKPLAQYAKGRKGGEGEYALVGEKGPEIMYVPKGASIVPNDKISKPETWTTFGVPKFDIPPLPSVPDDTMHYAAEQTAFGMIDYDKLGAAVARNIPAHKTVNVSIDKNGINVQDGNMTRKYLNQKYTGSWT